MLQSFFHHHSVYCNPQYACFQEFMNQLPQLWHAGEGVVIHAGRNELREMTWNGHVVVVKSFQHPNIVNRLVYGVIRRSKAYRSYQYACMLLKAGIGTPTPIGYHTCRHGIWFTESYYVSMKSACPYTFANLIGGHFEGQEQVLAAIAKTTANMHQHGYLHKDYSRGNILFRVEGQTVQVEIIDLNRIRFRHVGMVVGCKNFSRLPMTDAMKDIMASAYAKAMGFDPKQCRLLI